MAVCKPVGATSNTYCNRKYIHYNLLPTGAHGLFAHTVHYRELNPVSYEYERGILMTIHHPCRYLQNSYLCQMVTAS